MSINGTETHWLTRPATIKRLWVVFIVILAAVALSDLWLHGHPHFEVDGWFGFYSIYGLTTCVVMVVGAKLLGFILKRKDTYYERD